MSRNGKYTTRAERAFKATASAAIVNRDWDAVEKVYFQYGTYLELIGGGSAMEAETVRVEQTRSGDVRA